MLGIREVIFHLLLLAILFLIASCSTPHWEMLPVPTTPYDDRAEEYNQLRRLEKFCAGIGKSVDYLERRCR